MKAKLIIKQLIDAFNYASPHYRIYPSTVQKHYDLPSEASLDVFYLGDEQTPVTELATVLGLDKALSVIIEHSNQKV